MFSTIRLEAKNGSCGTGFFYNFKIGNDIVPVIVTNKHVVNNNPDEEMKFFLHLTEDGESSTENHGVNLKTKWHFHPTHDLCFSYCAVLNEAIPRITGKHAFYKAVDRTLIMSEKQLQDLSVSESVVMVGYPNGLWDSMHNFPIFRYGYTAAHPGYDFNEQGIGLVDISCFPGSSGSPIFIVNQGSVVDKEGNINLGSSRVVFLGILFAGPVFNATGEIKAEAIPTSAKLFSQTAMMINLGYYIKAHELNAFIPTIEKDLRAAKSGA